MSSPEIATSRSQDGAHRSYPIDHADRFDVRLDRALENPRLRNNLTAFQQGWRSARDRAAEEIDFSTLQTRMKRAKTAVTADLDKYLEQFRQAAEAAGGTAHFAGDWAAAHRIP